MTEVYTGVPNTLILTPVSGVVRSRMHAHVLRYGAEFGHSRSRPAERDSTIRPQFVKPVAATEKPLEAAPTVRPLEPARVPVPGAIPD